jgi:hypothetical protein
MPSPRSMECDCPRFGRRSRLPCRAFTEEDAVLGSLVVERGRNIAKRPGRDADKKEPETTTTLLTTKSNLLGSVGGGGG